MKVDEELVQALAKWFVDQNISIFDALLIMNALCERYENLMKRSTNDLHS